MQFSISLSFGGGGSSSSGSSNNQSDGQRQHEQMQYQQRQQQMHQQRQQMQAAQQQAIMVRAQSQTPQQREARLPATRAAIDPAYSRHFEDFLKTATPAQIDWFENNPKSFPLVAVNRETRLSSANYIRTTVPAAFMKEEKLRVINEGRLRDLEAAKAAILDDVAWRTGSLATLANVLGGTINAFCNLLLDTIPTSIGETPFNEFYAAVTDVLTNGDLLNFEAWRVAISDAMLSARIEDMATRSVPLAGLVAAFIAFAGKLADIAERDQDQKALRQEVETRIRDIENEIKKINQSSHKTGRMENVMFSVASYASEIVDLNFQYDGYLQMRSSVALLGTQRGAQHLFFAAWPFAALVAIRSREGMVDL